MKPRPRDLRTSKNSNHISLSQSARNAKNWAKLWKAIENKGNELLKMDIRTDRTVRTSEDVAISSEYRIVVYLWRKFSDFDNETVNFYVFSGQLCTDIKILRSNKKSICMRNCLKTCQDPTPRFYRLKK